MVVMGSLIEKIVSTLPSIGVASGIVFTVNVHAPKLFNEALGKHSALVSNTMWAATNVGCATYLYNSNTVHANPSRLYYSLLGSALFNFGSLLLVKTLSDAWCPQCQHLRACVAVGATLAIVASAKRYVDATTEASTAAFNAKVQAARVECECEMCGWGSVC